MGAALPTGKVDQHGQPGLVLRDRRCLKCDPLCLSEVEAYPDLADRADLDRFLAGNFDTVPNFGDELVRETVNIRRS
jgi:hypothetical protein